MGGVLSAVAFAMRATVHATNQASPMQLVFGRDAILNVSFQADWQHIKERKQKLVVQNDNRENAERKPHAHHVNDTVKIPLDPNRKHGVDHYQGPWVVQEVNDNGTLRLEQDTANGGVVYQTWNVRNVLPYRT